MSDQEYQEKHYTLIFCRKHTEQGSFILLGMKKRGFGTGKWNGFGGKVEENESFEQAAVRELYEESSVTCNQEDLLSMGYIVFKLEDSRRYMKVHVYQVWKFDGEPSESDEMRPRWFTEDAIPYDRMWLDDQYWLPMLLQNKKFIGRFDYEDEETLEDYSLKEQSV